ncbi:MAG: hypothetical protein DWQ35_19935 [Planctomycetota bacterium]|nr:MAG: hypothetical protein DWQ35_19935 [Planctomycetota bacterium]REK28406.1 MAG: hypothetical protein DWQ42_05365 [Planctomycetota bacterium]REK48422.1 MAG: hypothetical protein DWQ46_02515 [Planctomycetota bacterium]
MDDRIAHELDILRQQYPDACYQNRWVLLRRYQLSEGWEPPALPVAFFIREGYPGISPYGIYVPAGIRFQDQTPKNYKEPATPAPPFDGQWGVFSWEAADWRPAATPEGGHNLVNWVHGFLSRFREGR